MLQKHNAYSKGFWSYAPFACCPFLTAASRSVAINQWAWTFYDSPKGSMSLGVTHCDLVHFSFGHVLLSCGSTVEQCACLLSLRKHLASEEALTSNVTWWTCIWWSPPLVCCANLFCRSRDALAADPSSERAIQVGCACSVC